MSIVADLLGPGHREFRLDLGKTPAWWRIKRVTSVDMVQQGSAMLLALATPSEIAEVVAEAQAGRIDPTEATVRLLQRADTAKVQRQMAQQADHRRSVVAAGLVAIGRGSEGAVEWQAVRFTRNLAERDMTAGVITTDDLPGGMVEVLYEAIMDYTTDGGAAAQRVAAFRRGAGAASAPGPAGEPVREVAP